MQFFQYNLNTYLIFLYFIFAVLCAFQDACQRVGCVPGAGGLGRAGRPLAGAGAQTAQQVPKFAILQQKICIQNFKIARRVTSAEINDFVDRLINEIKKYIIDNNLDPMPLPDLVEGFEWEVTTTFC